MKRKQFGVEWFALITAICWGSGSFFGKRAMKIGHLSALVGITLRTALALILFLFLLLVFGRKLKINLGKELANAWKTSKSGLFQIIIFEGVLAGAIGMFLYYLAISGGELSLVMPLAFLSPFWGTLLAIGFRDEKITFQRTAGLLLTLSGIFIITSRMFTLEELLQWRIEYVALLTGICWGIGSFFGKKGMKKASISPFVGITIRSAVSLVVLLIAVFTLGPSLLDSHIIAELKWILTNKIGQFFLILLFEGIIAGFIGMSTYYYAIRKGDLSLVMPLAFTSPFWGTLFALIEGSESFSYQRLAGMTFIIYGIIFISSINVYKPIILVPISIDKIKVVERNSNGQNNILLNNKH
ncbi:MAG: EamA family transporter [Asgard group archaeon]|nr:EamA family transporter [Asgard group archaeon]